MRDGVVKTIAQMSESEKEQLWDNQANQEGVFVYFGMWKGPFNSEADAKSAYREWRWELQHS